MKLNRINWFGFVGSLAIIVLVLMSLAFAYPWWQLTIGQGFLEVDASPLNTNFSLLGTGFTIPLIWFLNLTCLLSLIASAIVMLLYSVVPTKSYSKDLLSFAYKKPIATLLIFVAGLFVITYAAGILFETSFPMVGSTIATLPTSMTGGATVNVSISTGFTWMFWLAAAAAVLCIAARFYHKKIVQIQAKSK